MHPQADDATGRSGETRIITFHGIGVPGRELEPGEAPFWIGRDRFCTILDRIVAHAHECRFVITFDDGNVSDLTIAAPELAGRGLTARFFVLTGRLGNRGSLAPGDVRELLARGMRIGSHGIAHRRLTTLAPDALDDELTRSRALLEEICATPVEEFSIPFGRYNASVLRALSRAGYTRVYSSDGGSARAGQFLRPRRSLRQDMSAPDIDRVLSGEPSPLRRLRRTISMQLRQRV